jgi:hypothetical protein
MVVGLHPDPYFVCHMRQYPSCRTLVNDSKPTHIINQVIDLGISDISQTAKVKTCDYNRKNAPVNIFFGKFPLSGVFAASCASASLPRAQREGTQPASLTPVIRHL